MLREIKVYGGSVLRNGIVVCRRNIGVRLADVGCQVGKSRQPRLEEFAARLCKMGVPDIEGGSRVTEWLALSMSPAKGFEQTVPLPQHPLVVGTYASEARPARNDEVIDEAAPFAGIPLDDRDVHWRKHHSANYPDDFAGVAQRSTVEPGSVGFPGVDLQLQRQLARI